MKHFQSHKQTHLRRRQPTVAPQDSTAAKLVLQKLIWPQSEHEDSELTPTQTPNSTPTPHLQLHHAYQNKQVQEQVPG